MFASAIAFSDLAEAVILLPVAIFTLRKLYQSSKSNFAYLLVAFTFGYVLNMLAYFLTYLYLNENV